MAGLVLHPLNVSQVVNEIVLRAITGERLLLANHNLHSLYLHQREPAVRKFYELADRTIIDGAPILWMASRSDTDLTSQHRVGSTDWLGGLLHVAGEAKLKIAFLAGKPGVADRAREEILKHYPTLCIDVRDGYFDTTPGSAGNEATLKWLDEVRPDILLVGMGMPRQEQWVATNYARINATVTCTVGGCLDYIGGEQSLAPRWMGRLGVEWAYRLSRDPARLWRRYLLEPPAVILRLAVRRVKLKHIR